MEGIGAWHKAAMLPAMSPQALVDKKCTKDKDVRGCLLQSHRYCIVASHGNSSTGVQDVCRAFSRDCVRQHVVACGRESVLQD